MHLILLRSLLKLLFLKLAQTSGNLDLSLLIEARNTGDLGGELRIHDKVIARMLLDEVIDSIHHVEAGDVAYTHERDGDGTVVVGEQTGPVDTEDTMNGGLTGNLLGKNKVSGGEVELYDGLLDALESGGAASDCECNDSHQSNKE